MKYLVKMETVETGLLPPEQMVPLMEQAIIPSMEAIVKMEGGKVLAGGGIAGARGGVAIMEAESNDEISEILSSLPFWGLMKIEVIPLQSLEETLEGARKNLDRLKAATK